MRNLERTGNGKEFTIFDFAGSLALVLPLR
jgi:hypothetical protein